MQIINFPALYPWFWIIAIAWSLFQGWVGYIYGLYICDSAKHFPTKRIRFLAYGFPHGAFYFVCTLSGFTAWYLAHLVSKVICDWSAVGAGTGTILIALAVFAVLGVSGALPRILYMGKRPV